MRVSNEAMVVFFSFFISMLPSMGRLRPWLKDAICPLWRTMESQYRSAPIWFVRLGETRVVVLIVMDSHRNHI